MELGSVHPANAEGPVTDPSRIADIPSLAANLQAMFGHEPHDIVNIFQQIIDGLPEQIALLDEQWVILAANEAWIQAAALYGYHELAPGKNYFHFVTEKANEGHSAAAPAAEGIRQIESGATTSFRYIYHGNDRWEGHSFQLCIHRLLISGRTYATVTRNDVTELVHLREMRAEFSHSLIEHQAEERRRMARELHDSTMQLLAGMGLSLGQLRRSRQSETTGHIVDEIEGLLDEAQRELRTISYLAHAPLVSELGLPKALRQLVGGFARRTGLNISLNAEDELRVTTAAGVAVYRMVQEALSNVHHHARATDVTVNVLRRRSVLHVSVSDNGIGMQPDLKCGVGLSSMRARIEEFGGRLMIRAGNPGTVVIASLPAHAEIRAVGDLAVAS